jgi:hypothetical protein
MYIYHVLKSALETIIQSMQIGMNLLLWRSGVFLCTRNNGAKNTRQPVLLQKWFTVLWENIICKKLLRNYYMYLFKNFFKKTSPNQKFTAVTRRSRNEHLSHSWLANWTKESLWTNHNRSIWVACDERSRGQGSYQRWLTILNQKQTFPP